MVLHHMTVFTEAIILDLEQSVPGQSVVGGRTWPYVYLIQARLVVRGRRWSWVAVRGVGILVGNPLIDPRWRT